MVISLPHEHRWQPAEIEAVNPATGVSYKVLGQRCSCGEARFAMLKAKTINQYRADVLRKRANAGQRRAR